MDGDKFHTVSNKRFTALKYGKISKAFKKSKIQKLT